MITAEIYRYNPELDKKPYMQSYSIEEAEAGLMVLDLLERLKEKDPTLTYRRSCREGVCGSDALNINGRNQLACIVPLSSIVPIASLTKNTASHTQNKIIIRPLPAFPVIRDLVVDLSEFFKQYESVKPYLINDELPPEIERRQTPEQRAKLDGLYECILCACCSSACPSYWWNPDKFAGPAALLQAYRFLADSRDTGTAERLALFDEDAYKLFRCRQIGNCVDVCPKKLNPQAAIGKIRQLLLKEAI